MKYKYNDVVLLKPDNDHAQFYGIQQVTIYNFVNGEPELLEVRMEIPEEAGSRYFFVRIQDIQGKVLKKGKK